MHKQFNKMSFVQMVSAMLWALVGLSAQPAAAAMPVQQWFQPSGAKVVLVQSPSIPMVDVQIDFDAGARRDPQNQSGLADVMAGMLSKGVQATASEPALDENAISEHWMDLGAMFGASVGNDRLSISLRSLTDPDLLQQAAQLAAREIGQPSFPPEIWQRERERLNAALKEALTKPGTVAGLAFSHAVYGDHPYGYATTTTTLAHIEVADLQQAHKELLACRAVVTVVGALDQVQADALVTRLLSRLPTSSANCQARPPVPDVASLTAAQDLHLPFDSAQAHVLIGQPGFKRADPDYFPLTLGNYILGGGGFVSRLTAQVREKRGLSYSVYSYFAPALSAGAFTIGLQTRPDQAAQAVQVAQQVLADFVANGPTEAELRAAKANYLGGFALQLDSNRKLLGNVANIAWNNLPLNYLDTWPEHIEQVTVAQIKAAFQRKLQPEKMVTVVVGGQP